MIAISRRWIGACSYAALSSTFASAQTSAPPATSSLVPSQHTERPSDNQAAAGEIIVTAQKREQSINSVGLTIQAATAETMTAKGITGPTDLGKLVPGLSFTQSSLLTPVYTLRGIGLYDASFGSSSPVAIYTDQVPRNFPVMSDALDLDIERVEVLKGPQGTLFGQSSTGGAINYIVAKPTSTFHAGLDASYERFGKADISGFVSGPLTDTLEARVAVRAINGGAWQYSISRPNDKNGDTRKFEGRLILDWHPTDRIKFETSLTGARDRSDVQAPQYTGSPYDIYSAASLAAADANPATRNPYAVVNDALYASLTTPGSPNFDSSYLARQDTLSRRLNDADPGSPNSAAAARAILGTPIMPGNARAADWTEGFLKPSNNNYIQATVRADYTLSDALTLTSITSFARSALNYNVDLDGTAASSVDVPVSGTIHAFNEEVRLSGRSNRFNWIVGGNYDHATTRQDNFFDLSQYSGSQPIPTIAPLDFTLNQFNTRLRTYAAFANGDFKITSRLKLSGGIRYTRTTQAARYCYQDPASDAGQTAAQVFTVLQGLFSGNPALPPIGPNQCFALGDGTDGTTFGVATLSPVERHLSEHNISYRAGLDYQLPGSTLLYATVSQGYKAGIFSNIGATSVAQYSPAVQEKVVAYEAGFKAALFHRRLQWNSAAFYYDYTNKQIRAKVFDQGPFGLLDKVINVPKSYVWGVETELSARPLRGLSLGASATYLNSKVSKAFAETGAGEAVYNSQGYTGDFKGSALPYTSKFSGNADIRYEWIAGSIKPFVGASLYFQTRQNATFSNATLAGDQFRIPGYFTVDGQVGIASGDDRWRLTIYGRNLFNRYYFLSPTFYQDAYFYMAGHPAVYGLAARFRF